jgi:hypothetical protein
MRAKETLNQHVILNHIYFSCYYLSTSNSTIFFLSALHSLIHFSWLLFKMKYEVRGLLDCFVCWEKGRFQRSNWLPIEENRFTILWQFYRIFIIKLNSHPNWKRLLVFYSWWKGWNWKGHELCSILNPSETFFILFHFKWILI